MKATLLNSTQALGSDGYFRTEGQLLEVFRHYGTQAGLSDLAIFLGGALSLPHNNPATTMDGKRSGFIYTSSSPVADFPFSPAGDVTLVSPYGSESRTVPQSRDSAIRPALPPEITSSITPDKEKAHPKKEALRIVEYGEYPQSIASDSEDLEREFQKQPFAKTGAKYTFDGEEVDAYDKPFNPQKYDEYEHDGKRYIRVEARPTLSYKQFLDGHLESNAILSNGKEVKEGDIGWIEVQPVEWLADPSGWWVSRQALAAGVQYDAKEKYDGKFDDTNANKFINEHLLKEMLQTRRSITMSTLEYPQDLAPDAIRDGLEKAYSQGTLRATGASYFEGQKYDGNNPPPSAAAVDQEYELGDKRYVRTVGGKETEEGKGYWFEVKPIEFGADGLGKKSLWSRANPATGTPEPMTAYLKRILGDGPQNPAARGDANSKGGDLPG